jgi:hypothetical protein
VETGMKSMKVCANKGGGSEKRQRPLCPNPLDETEVAEAASLLIGPRQLEDQKCCKECENVRSAPQRQLLFL